MKIGLVLEGGACKGIFTAGVLDYWMEQKLSFPYIVSVSAGTCNALDYMSDQAERTKQCMIPSKADSFIGIKRFFKTGHIFDLDRVFHEYPFKQFPFDGETYLKSPVKNEMVVTNCRTGKAEYLTEKQDVEMLLLKGQASSSIPLLADMVEIDDEKYLDGSMSDSIPVVRAIEAEQCDKVVVVMTHNKGYIPSVSRQLAKLYRRKYRKYPELIETLCERPRMYEEQLKKLDEYEKQGKAYVIWPTETAVRRMERDSQKMEHFYQHGYQRGIDTYDEVINFMNKDLV